MKITVKTLQGDQFSVEAEGSSKVADLKKQVGEQQKFEPPEDCKLIFNGSVLKNDTSLEEAKMKDGCFIVVMPPRKARAATESKKKAEEPPKQKEPEKPKEEAPKPAAAEPAGATSTAPASTAPASTAPASTAPASTAPASTAPASTSPAPTAQGGGQANTLLTGDEYEATIKQICEMGFEEKTVKQAMQAAFNNPDRAVEYLFNGIPANTVVPQASEPSLTPTLGQAGELGATSPEQEERTAPQASNEPFNMFEPRPAGGARTERESGPLDALRNHPHLNLMKYVAQRRPELLEQLFQQIARSNPALVSLINTNQAEFMRLLHEPIPPEQQAALDQALESMVGEEGLEALGGMEGEGRPPGSTVIQITEDERAQIERLESIVVPMGINRSTVLEAWLACDKNEELAANYLLNSMEDLLREEEQGGDDANT